MSMKEDCFAFKRKEEGCTCTILKELYCKTEKDKTCRFYKPKGTVDCFKIEHDCSSYSAPTKKQDTY